MTAVAAFAPHAMSQERWIAGWTFPPFSTAGPVVPPSPPNPNDIRGPMGPAGAANETLIQTVRVTAAGSGLRLRFSNLYGAQAVRLGAVSVSIDGAPPTPVTFDGEPGLTLPAGAPRLSDPIVGPVEALDPVTVSVFYPDQTPLPHHRLRQLTLPGDVTGGLPPADVEPSRKGVLLSAVEVLTDQPTGVIVAFGDSITEGVSASPAGPGGWPERLARRMIASDASWAVVNAGIGGNRLLHQGSGPSALERLDSDALAVPGARCLILLEGVNDIGRPSRAEYAHEAITAQDLIGGYRQVIARAHAAGIRTVIATIPPFGGAPYFTDAGEDIRLAANAWIRTSGEPDAVVDFDAATRDPERPGGLLGQYDSGDRLHPSDAGYEAMAQAIPLDICDPRG